MTEPWHLNDFISALYDTGEFDTFIENVFATNNFPLGTFSCSVTHPVNNKTIIVYVNGNSPKQSRIAGMRVREDDYGFIPIKHDRESLQQVVEDIKNETLPLFNVNDSNEVMKYHAYASMFAP